jgi:hypothetical protein
MEFDLIVGRTAIRRHRMVVNPSRSFLAGLPKCVSSAVSVGSGRTALSARRLRRKPRTEIA